MGWIIFFIIIYWLFGHRDYDRESSEREARDFFDSMNNDRDLD